MNVNWEGSRSIRQVAQFLPEATPLSLCILTKEFFAKSVDNRYKRVYYIDKMNGINRSQKRKEVL